jgi:hypothetical protein
MIAIALVSATFVATLQAQDASTFLNADGVATVRLNQAAVDGNAATQTAIGFSILQAGRLEVTVVDDTVEMSGDLRLDAEDASLRLNRTRDNRSRGKITPPHAVVLRYDDDSQSWILVRPSNPSSAVWTLAGLQTRYQPHTNSITLAADIVADSSKSGDQTIGRFDAEVRLRHISSVIVGPDGAVQSAELPATSFGRDIAGGNNGTVCPTPVGTDVIVGVLPNISNYTAIGGIEAYAVGTTSCNIGDANLLWIANSNQHPVIGQNMYRLKDDRFVQVGQSWLKHGFTALTQNECGCGCSGVGGSVLGIGCSDPYSSGLNGQQGGLGPKFEVNAHSGFFEWPYTGDGATGDSIYKRLQVAISDLDPAQNGGGLYFVEGHYIAPDDATAGNGNNNASYRPVNITGGSWTASMSGTTQREQPGIRAWQDTDPTVIERNVQVSGDGLIIAASKAISLGGGQFRYEYAVQNLNCDRSVGSFSVPVAGSVSNSGFHDVPYHSGEPFDGTDWTATVSGGSITWATDDFATNPNANALRWSTLYNFWFETDAPPVATNVVMGLFKPGTPNTVNVALDGPAAGPLDCNLNGEDDEIDIANGTSQDCNDNLIPDECESFATCTLVAAPVATGLTAPLYVTSPPADINRLFIVEQAGIIKILTGAGVLGTNYLNISGIVSSGGERGLLGLAFDPDFDANAHFYVNYTNLAGNTVIARYTATGADPASNTANAGSALILKTITQDFPNHNGGGLQFGPDGMLYCGMGDGGSGDDPNERAQDDGSLLGKMLRLDVNNGPTYIPADNPHVGAGLPLDEIWSKGLRNPWRFSFDRNTGDMYIGDVGQDAREEIDFQPASSTGAENYGWDCREGFIASPAGGDDCTDPPYVDPILDEAHINAPCDSIVGGYVYRGCNIPWLNGTYFYADTCLDYIRTFEYVDGDPTPPVVTDRTAELGFLTSVVSFGEDASGELYIVSQGGTVYKLICEGSTECGNGSLDPGEVCDPPDGVDCDCTCQPLPCDDAFADNFECDTGWTDSSSGASSGFWQRGVPVDDDFWDWDPASDADGSGSCYLTQNVTGNTDVDGGSVTLTSPTIDMSPGDVTISYQYFLNLSNDDGTDQLLVEINNNDGVGAWTTLVAHTTNGALTWRPHTINQADLDAAGVVLTSTMRVRFTANDGDPQSINEAGLDAFSVTSVCFPDCNDNGQDDALDISGCSGDPACGDCNSNSIPDGCDIADNSSDDCDGGPVGVPANGAVLFNGNGCFACHSADGSGSVGPNIRNKSRTELLFITTAEHPGGVFGFTAQEFADLEGFLADNGSRGRPDGIPDECQTLDDCDVSGASDGCELENGTQVDTDYNGVPDDCDDPCVEPCDDGNACTINDTCVGLVCLGTPVDCSGAAIACTVASCDLAGAEGNCDIVTPVADGTGCDDSDACTVSDTCQAGSCQSGSSADCSGSGDDCNTAACDSGSTEGNCDIITPLTDGTTCDDGSVCTVDDSCQSGLCQSGSPPDCGGAGDDCNGASCDIGGGVGNCDNFGPINEGGPCNAGSGTCAAGVCIDPGDTRVFMVRAGQQNGAPLVGNTQLSMSPGTAVTIEVWAADTDGVLMNGFQWALPGDANAQGGATGTVTYVDNFDPDGGDSVGIDIAHPSWVFAADGSATNFMSETGLPDGFAAISNLPFGSGVEVPDGEIRYLGEFQMEASGDADGTFSLMFLPDGAPPNGGSALVDITGIGEIQANYQPLSITVEASACSLTADCGDTDGDGVTDDVCKFWDCESGICTTIDRPWADAGGPFGDCPPDGFANVHDITHVLRCFSGIQACDTFNDDIGGPFGLCPADGFCNVHDVKHVELDFGGTNLCSCPIGPAPDMPVVITGQAELQIVGPRIVKPGGTVDLQVRLSSALEDLQKYQLDAQVTGGSAGQLELVNVRIDARKDAVFAGRDDLLSAFNITSGQMLSGLSGDGVATAPQAYLATFTYEATADAIGDFVIDVPLDGQTFLISTDNGMIELLSSVPARIEVTTQRDEARR